MDEQKLKPFIVLKSDPRWDACIYELRRLVDFAKSASVGLDSEFWECPRLRAEAEATGRTFKRDDNFDPWSCRLRCLQVGLPSGLVLLLDFGHCFDRLSYDDYRVGVRCPTPYDDILPLLGQLCASRRISKIGWSLGTEALILRRHFGWRIRRARDGMLASQVLWAGVGAKDKRWTQAGLTPCERVSHSFKATAERVGVEIDKEEQSSDWGAAELTVSQLNYAGTDVAQHTLFETWRRLTEMAKREGVLDSILIECEAAPAFWECEWRGTPLDAEVCTQLAADYKRAGDKLYAEVSAALGGAPTEGDGSQKAIAVGLTRYLDVRGLIVRDSAGRPVNTLFRWERKRADGRVETRRDLNFMPDAVPPKPRKPVKGKAPTKRAGAAAAEAWQASYTRRMAEYAAELERWEVQMAEPKWQFRPDMGEAALAPFDSDPIVSALMEARSCRNTQGALEKRAVNSWAGGDGRLATRCRYWQIAGGFDAGRGESSDAGAGTGRSSSSKPLNNQNVTTYPLGKKRCSELGLRNVRVCVAPPAGRAMIVGDFSQAHMRFFAQVSQDEALLEDFQAGRDAHIRLARDFYIAYRPDAPLSQKSFAEWCEAYQAGKGHPDFDAIKEPRVPAKNGNYSFLNMGSAQKVRQIAETSPEPIHLPQTIDVGGEDRDPWEVVRERWREVYATGYQYQKNAIRSADRQSHCFDFTDGEYGAVWSADGKRRLYLLKEWNVPQWAESPDDGRYSVKGTEALAGIMQMSEANALKMAAAFAVEQFDAHPEWEAFIFNIVHDELDAECAGAYRLEVARCIHESMQRGMRLAGIVDLPTCAPDDTPEKLIVKSWADK